MAPRKKPAKAAAKKSVASTSPKKASKTTSAKKSPARAKKAASKKAVVKKAAAKNSATKPAKKSTKAASTAGGQEARKIPANAKYLADAKWLASQREALISERAKYTSSAERLAAEAAALMADREPGDVQFDEESGEGDTIAVERDRDLALSAAARQAVAEIDAALSRLDQNVYGFCTAGDDIIPRERLEAIPEAAVCVMHKTLMFS